jgi:PhnB protein
MAVKPIPEGYPSVSPYLTVDDGKGAIEFYKRAFGATERGSMSAPDGRIAHAELEIGDSIVMLSDPFPQFDARSPKDIGGSTVAVHLYVEDVDAVVQDAVDAGAKITMNPVDQFWGERLGRVTDPFGHIWLIASRVEDLTPEQVAARAREAFAAMSG